MSINVQLRSGAPSPADVYLRPDRSPVVDVYLWPGAPTATDVYLRRDGRPVYSDAAPAPVFPTQYAGLRFFKGSVQELCLVALADAPAGNQWRIDKNGTTYAVYLVDTTDPNASHVRIQTSAGVKAARLKT